MSFPRSVTDDDLRDDCARVLRKMISLGAKVEIDPAPANGWWRLEAPARSARMCRFELVMTAVLIGRGCTIHRQRRRLGRHGERFGSRRLNQAFCQAVREVVR